jgi:RNA polymerase sigma-70 factor (ECF subfamily)
MTSTLLEQLQDADPARGLAGHDDARLRATAREVLRGARTGAPARRPPRPVARRLAALAPVAAVAAALLVVAPALTGDRGASAEAAALLDEAATHVTSTDPVAGPGDWWEVRTTGFTTGVLDLPSGQVTVLTSRDDTTYLAVDGSRPSVVVDGPTHLVRQLAGPPVTAEDLAGWQRSERRVLTSDLAPRDAPGGWGTASADFLAGLPREASALRERLYADVDAAGGGGSRDGRAFALVASTLRTGVVPADLRAALYRVLATVPGVEVTDREARVGPGAGVAFGRLESTDGRRSELVVVPSTGELLGEREVATRGFDGVPAGTVTGETRVTRSVVDRVPADVVAEAEVWRCRVTDDGVTACSP